jgi:hypothetical protein
MAAPTDNKDLSQAPTSGSITEDFYFAGQNSSGASSGIIQKAKVSIFKVTAAISDYTDTIKWVTPKAFTESIGDATNAGTFKLSETADITARTAANKALTPSNLDDIQDELFDSEVISGDISSTTYPLLSTLTNDNLIKLPAGNLCILSGSFEFQPASDTRYIEITINNLITVPLSQGGAATWNRTDSSTDDRNAAGCEVKTGGSDSVTLRIGRSDASNFSSTVNYKFYINASIIGTLS